MCSEDRGLFLLVQVTDFLSPRDQSFVFKNESLRTLNVQKLYKVGFESLLIRICLVCCMRYVFVIWSGGRVTFFVARGSGPRRVVRAWLKEPVCKTGVDWLRWFESITLHSTTSCTVVSIETGDSYFCLTGRGLISPFSSAQERCSSRHQDS